MTTASAECVAVVPTTNTPGYEYLDELEEMKIRRSRVAETGHRPPGHIGRVMLPVFAALTLAWWISGLIVKEAKHQW